MGQHFGLALEEMIGLSKPEWEADRSQKLRRDEEGELVWNFGRTRGERVKDHPGLIHWVLERDFPRDTKAILEALLERMDEESGQEGLF